MKGATKSRLVALARELGVTETQRVRAHPRHRAPLSLDALTTPKTAVAEVSAIGRNGSRSASTPVESKRSLAASEDVSAKANGADAASEELTLR